MGNMKPNGVGLALDLTKRISSPPAVLHYQHGRVQHYHYEERGQKFVMTCVADWDGIGFRVYETSIRHIVIDAGAQLDYRFDVIEHHGDTIVCADRKGRRYNIPFDDGIVNVHEAKAPEPPVKI